MSVFENLNHFHEIVERTLMVSNDKSTIIFNYTYKNMIFSFYRMNYVHKKYDWAKGRINLFSSLLTLLDIDVVLVIASNGNIYVCSIIAKFNYKQYF